MRDRNKPRRIVKLPVRTVAATGMFIAKALPDWR
jgi:hypothetical protein